MRVGRIGLSCATSVACGIRATGAGNTVNCGVCLRMYVEGRRRAACLERAGVLRGAFVMPKGGHCIKTVNVTLPRELTHVNLHVLADLHIGDRYCDDQLAQRRVKAIADDPAAYLILNGDILNNAIKASPSDIYGEIMSPIDQLTYVTKLFEPVQDKIIAITSGNHESRTYKQDGIDIMRLFARQIGKEDRYAPEGILVFLRFGATSRNKKDSSGKARMVRYVIYATHGSGGGRKEGAKAIRLADMASIVDADIYLHSHTHLPMIMKQAFYRTSEANNAVALVDKLFVNTGSMLDYGGYGQAYEYKPATKETPVLWLSGVKWDARATL